MEQLFFPYSQPRPGQLELARRMVDAYKRGRKLIVEAPNGFGKTASALSAAYHITNEYGAGVIYAVRTKRECERVLQEARLFGERFQSKISVMMSMSDGCLLRRYEVAKIEDELLPTYCLTHVMSKKCRFFERLSSPAALVWKRFDSLTGLLDYAKLNGLCPYMFSRKLCADSQIIVTTYNHVIDKERLQALKTTRQNWRDWMLVCDEAHNIQELAFSMNSRVVELHDIEAAYEYSSVRRDYNVSYIAHSLISLIKKKPVSINEQLLFSLEFPREVDRTALRERLRMISLPSLPPPFDLFEARHQLSFMKFLDFCRFLGTLIDRDDYRIFLGRSERDLYLKAVILFPKIDLAASSFRSVVYLSATFGAKSEDFEVYSLSKESDWNANCLTVIDGNITSAYSKRSDTMFRRISQSLRNIRKFMHGPVAVFFTSYNMLNRVLQILSEEQGQGIDCFVEKPGMSVSEQENLIGSFLSRDDGLLLAVSGGKFAEGEDYRSGELKCAVIVGLPLPPPSLELSERLNYLASTRGRRYAYDSLVLLPAVNRVVQSAGRVVRSPKSRGIAILMDKRFTHRTVQGFLPFWMKRDIVHADCSDPSKVREVLS
ncbi:MAG: helicase C-terminal domain-containing protein [Conexivisphaerales archaeon]